MGSGHRHADGLSSSQVEEFIERGYLVLRDCLPAERMREMTHRTIIERDPAPTYRGRDELRGDGEVEGLDLLDAKTWPFPSLHLDTKRILPIAEFAPKLWGALRTLVGDRHYIDRRTMGEQVILNGDYRPPPCPAFTPEYRDDLFFHIDAPSKATTFEGRHDALVLLILWSKVEPGGGGPLFTGESLDRVVQQIDAAPDGVDTLNRKWGTRIGRECGDVFEFTGDVGDVLISHAFALHAAHSNYGEAMRVLENPTITIRGVLDYRSDNPDPSPVEACVIRRRSKQAPADIHPKTAIAKGAQALLRHHPDYFLPGRGAWQKRTNAQTQRRVRALDAGLWSAWVQRVTDRIRHRRQGVVGELKIAMAMVRELVANELYCGVRVGESLADGDFVQTPWSRLMRGMVNGEGQNYVLATLLARMFERVELRRLPSSGHVLVRVVTPEGSAFVDAWAGRLFHVASIDTDPVEGVPEYAQLGTSGERTHFEREQYESSEVVPLVSPPEPEADLETLTRALASDAVARVDVWGRYIAARIDQLVGHRNEAHRSFSALSQRLAPSTATGKITQIFAERTGADHYTLDF